MPADFIIDELRHALKQWDDEQADDPPDVNTRTIRRLLEEIDRLHKVNAKLVETIESLLEVGSVVQRDDDILENNRRRELARVVLAEAKET